MIVSLNSNITMRATPDDLVSLLRVIASSIEAGWDSGSTPLGDWWLNVEEYDEED